MPNRTSELMKTIWITVSTDRQKSTGKSIQVYVPMTGFNGYLDSLCGCVWKELKTSTPRASVRMINVNFKHLNNQLNNRSTENTDMAGSPRDNHQLSINDKI